MHPLNPRHHPNHRERGLKRWHYTYGDIARVTGLSLVTVRNYSRRGKYDPGDLANLIRWAAPYVNKRRAALEAQEERAEDE